MPYSDYFTYHAGSITRLVHILADNGITSKQDLMERFDLGATAYQYAALKGVGPVLSALLVWLRGKSPDEWRELTGLPAFNVDLEPHSHADEEWG